MHYKLLIDTDWLGQWDLPLGRDVVVTIDRVERYKPDRQKKGERVRRIVIRFVGKRKAWLAGPTSQKVIARLYGPDVREWIGKPLALYVDESVEFGGVVTGGIRVQPFVPHGEQTREALDNPAPQEKIEQLEQARVRAEGDDDGKEA